jgi:hypothetical protein
MMQKHYSIGQKIAFILRIRLLKLKINDRSIEKSSKNKCGDVLVDRLSFRRLNIFSIIQKELCQ